MWGAVIWLRGVSALNKRRWCHRSQSRVVVSLPGARSAAVPRVTRQRKRVERPRWWRFGAKKSAGAAGVVTHPGTANKNPSRWHRRVKRQPRSFGVLRLILFVWFSVFRHRTRKKLCLGSKPCRAACCWSLVFAAQKGFARGRKLTFFVVRFWFSSGDGAALHEPLLRSEEPAVPS